MNPWPLVAADLRRHPAGAAALVLLVAVAVALGVAVSAQERALRRGSAAAAEKFPLVVGAPGGEAQLVLAAVFLQPAALDLLPPGVLADLAAERNAGLVSPVGFGDSHAGHPVVGVAPAFVGHLAGSAALAEGRAFARVDEAVVGADVAALAVGDAFAPVHGHAREGGGEVHAGFAYRVVGRLPRLGNPWDRAILAPIESVWWVHGLPVGHELDEARLFPAGGEPDLGAIPIGPPWDRGELAGVPAVVVVPAGFAAGYQLRQAYRSRPDANAVFPAEVLVGLYRLLGDARDVLALVSLLTQALVIGAVMLAVLASLAQRRRLVAVLRALGASRGFVFAAVWLGVALLLAAGAVLGLGLGRLAAGVLAGVAGERAGVALPVALGWPELRLVLATVAAGLALAAVPAALAHRGPVAAGLRG